MQVTGQPVAGRDRLATTAARAAAAAAQMIFKDGFFHADPHPGNPFVEATGRIGLIDFGMVGELDEQLRKRLGKLLLAFSRNDPDRISRAPLELSVNRTAPTVVSSGRTWQVSCSNSRVGVWVRSSLRNHHIQLPRGIAMLTKMVILTEGMGRVSTLASISVKYSNPTPGGWLLNKSACKSCLDCSSSWT